MIDVPNTLLEKGYEGLSDEEATAVLEHAMAEVRARRNKLLTITDVYSLPDYPFTDEERESLLAYRQSLRDMTVSLEPTYNTNTMELQGVEFPSHPLVNQEMYNSTGSVHIVGQPPTEDN